MKRREHAAEEDEINISDRADHVPQLDPSWRWKCHERILRNEQNGVLTEAACPATSKPAIK